MSLSVRVTDHIATVSMTETTLGPGFFAELSDAFRAIDADEDVRVAILDSTTKAFSYGLDLPRVMQKHGHLFAGGGLARDRRGLHDLIRQWQDDVSSIARCRVPVIAAIHGWCIGGGLDLAAACDIRLASVDAKISLRETKIAIVADLGSLQRLPAIVGEGHARELAFTGRDIDTERAVRIGLVNDVFPDRDALGEAALALARSIAANPPLVVTGVKDVMEHGRRDVEEGLRYVAAWNSAFLASEDLSEALAAFLEKRAPRFQGK